MTPSATVTHSPNAALTRWRPGTWTPSGPAVAVTDGTELEVAASPEDEDVQPAAISRRTVPTTRTLPFTLSFTIHHPFDRSPPARAPSRNQSPIDGATVDVLCDSPLALVD